MFFFGGLTKRDKKGYGEGVKNVHLIGEVLNECSLCERHDLKSALITKCLSFSVDDQSVYSSYFGVSFCFAITPLLLNSSLYHEIVA